MSNFALVVDTHRKPLTPCAPGVARSLLKVGKAVVFRQYPFTIILKKEVKDAVQTCQLKIDPGSKTTGFAVLQGNKVVWGAELTHRGQAIKNSLESRRSQRKGRRARKTRYRPSRFLNRTRPEAWLAPSLRHRVLTTMTWVNRLIKLCAIESIAQELVKFDTQAIQKPEISGIEYQQGTLFQYGIREYLLEKWGRKCAYCGARKTPLEVEHIIPRSKGGSNRVSNLCIACVPCNKSKSDQSIEDFLSDKPDILKRIKIQAKSPLNDAAAMNATRWQLLNSLKELGLPVTYGNGGQTKFNRSQQGIPKSHWLDAACVGEIPKLEICTNHPLLIQAMGHGGRQIIHVDKYGFPRRNSKGKLVRKSALIKVVKGFQTGDIVRAVVPTGKKAGTYLGRVAVRSRGSFNIKIQEKTIQGISYKHCTLTHKKDGYSYTF